MTIQDDPDSAGVSHSKMSPRFSEQAKILAFVILAVTVVGLGYLFRDSLSLEYLAQQETALRGWRETNPIPLFALAFLLYVAVAGFAIPGAAALSLMYGWYFGFWPALVVVSLSSTLGATISFLVSRFLLRDSIRSRFGQRLQAINENLEKEGLFYLFTLRLIPVFPFFMINLVMGLTPIKTWTFWWVSQIGMLPGTAVFVWAGASVPSLQQLAEQGVSGILNWKIMTAFALLGVFPLVVKKLMAWIRSSDTSLNRKEAA